MTSLYVLTHFSKYNTSFSFPFPDKCETKCNKSKFFIHLLFSLAAIHKSKICCLIDCNDMCVSKSNSRKIRSTEKCIKNNKNCLGRSNMVDMISIMKDPILCNVIFAKIFFVHPWSETFFDIFRYKNKIYVLINHMERLTWYYTSEMLSKSASYFDVIIFLYLYTISLFWYKKSNFLLIPCVSLLSGTFMT